MRKEIYEKNGNQESSDTLPFHWEFGKEEITLKVSSYAYGNGLAVLMYSQSEGELELFGDLTVNLPGGYGLEPQEAFVRGRGNCAVTDGVFRSVDAYSCFGNLEWKNYTMSFKARAPKDADQVHDLSSGDPL